MKVQNTQNIYTNPQNTTDSPAHNLRTAAEQLAQTGKTVLHSAPQPDIQKILHKTFSFQLEMLAGQASSSSDPKRTALLVLQSRAGKPAAGSTLEIPVTGKALGGTTSSSSDEDEDLSLEERLEVIQQSIEEERGYSAQLRAELSTRPGPSSARKEEINRAISNSTDAIRGLIAEANALRAEIAQQR
jgi:hypothetical protein